jgi:uncharacterized protein (DUF433 family)
MEGAMSDSYDYLGRGIYSIPEAAALTGISASQIRRWVLGYGQSTASDSLKHEALFTSDFPKLENAVSISFLDLIEVLFIRSFRKHGVPWRSIRTASVKAAKLLESPHPFARRAFHTDGKDILTRVAHESKDNELSNLVRDQYEMDDLVSPALYENIDFGELDLAKRWWPIGRDHGVVLDPALNLGKPVIAAYNIPTATLARLAKSAGDIQEVANWYEIDEDSVRAAVEYETTRAA